MLEADDLRQQRLTAPADQQHVRNARARQQHAQEQASDANDPPNRPKRCCFQQARAKRLYIHGPEANAEPCQKTVPTNVRDLPASFNRCHDFRVKLAFAHRGAGPLVFALLVGCQASVNADANVSGEGAKARAQADLSGSGDGEGELRRASLAEVSAKTNAAMTARDRVLLGARHDLRLEGGKGAASCQCLSVALGGVKEAGMSWSSTPPRIDESTQLTIALSSEGQACPAAPKQSLGASYWGYRISGDNVIVLVEAARDGRPLTSGAIIPRPVGQGQVFVAPAGKSAPYGRALDGNGPCKIGNPGPGRTTPFSELEIGSDAPRPASGEVNRSSVGAGPSRNDDTLTTIEIPPG